MKIDKIILKKLSYLLKLGFSYTYLNNEHIFYECIFKRDDLCVEISYDMHMEFLDLKIKKEDKILLETAYSEVVIDFSKENTDIFAEQLHSIYDSVNITNLSLTDNQLNLLLDLYSQEINLFLT